MELTRVAASLRLPPRPSAAATPSAERWRGPERSGASTPPTRTSARRSARLPPTRTRTRRSSCGAWA
eukprot:6261820-Pyramimonas_sp.AAC.1